MMSGIYGSINPSSEKTGASLEIFFDGVLFDKSREKSTDIIADLYRQYGDKCASYMEGQFNFCVWDRGKKQILLATDRFGTSPLYYYFDGKNLAFASKLSSILESGAVKPEIDKNAIYNFLNFGGFIPAPETIYKGIKKLEAGSFVVLENGVIKTEKYWDIDYAEDRTKSENYYKDKIFSTIEDAVKICIESCPDKERIGAFLSGGLDSSAVCGMMTILSGKGAKAFSIGFKEKTHSELEYARIAAKHFGLEPHEYIVTPKDALESFKILAKGYDEPYGNTSAIAAYYCMKAAKDNGVDFIFGGDGGDENFAGYTRYVTNKQFLLYQYIPRILRKAMIEPCTKILPVKKAKNYVHHANIPDPERLFIYNFYPMYNREEIFSEDFLHAIDYKTPLNIINGIFNSSGTKDILNSLLYVDTKLGLIDNDLRGKIDSISRLLGIQALYPLLNTELWALGGKIPSNLKLKGFNKKYIYKKAFEKFLPKEILQKKKHGFGLPYAVWLRANRDVRRFTEEILFDQSVYKRGYFKQGVFEKLIVMNDKEASPYYGDLLSVFLMLELWFRERIDR